MKKLFLFLLCLYSVCSYAQVYNNEWIDPAKTYYKFKVSKNGVHRISYSELNAAGLGNAMAEHFQLWRNGVQVPVYITVSTGALSATDYIEFWGEMNDGKPDKELYRRPEYQLNDKHSLETDTASYFLTLNVAGNNLRLVNTANNIAGNTLLPEPYFMYTVGNYYKNKINPGNAIDVDEYLYSSSYEFGEGYTSADVATQATASFTFSGLNVYAAGPQAKIKIAVSGNSNRPRSYRLKINADSVLGNEVNYFSYALDSATFPLSIIAGNSANVQVTNLCAQSNDRMVIHKYELTYPRQFNFGNATNFEFYLPASTTAKYLEIKSFSNSNVAPVLLDLTNGRRYTGNIATSGTVKFVIQPSAVEQRFVLTSAVATNITNVAALNKRTFTNFSNPQQQSNYIIISNKLLYNGANGTNPVEEYRAYRSSGIGGGYNARVHDIDDIIDQFGFGIKKNPAAIRNFLRYARNNFSVEPKYVFLIGKGVLYNTQRSNESNASIELLNLIPTFGNPASDNLYTAEPGSSLPLIPIGRLSVVSAAEVDIYLKKVKDFEAAQRAQSPLRSEKEWMKNVVHVVGASEPALQITLDNYFNKYKQIITDTAFGAQVSTFTKTSANGVEQLASSELDNLFKKGISLITYFGHSSSSTLEFNLDNPQNYDNSGKYPMFVALGCNAGGIFNFNTSRLQVREAISEKFVLAAEKGTIGFIASTHFGIPYYLNVWNSEMYGLLSSSHYNKPIGDILIKTSANILNIQSEDDLAVRANLEQTELHGDPAVKINMHPLADYVIDEPQLKISPEFISVAEPAITVKAAFINIGKAVNKPVKVEVKRVYPNNVSEVVYTTTLAPLKFSDSIEVKLPIDALKDKGLNKITVTIDSDNEVEELFETNNTITKEVFIYEDEIKPVYPYEFAIVNKPNITLVASTANALSELRSYVFEMDTTALFNSSVKYSKTIASKGGVVEVTPSITLTDKTVYYWRVSMVPTTGNYHWNTSSFTYLKNSSEGFNQSHVFQHFASVGNNMIIDSTKAWRFDYISNDLFIKHGVWGGAATVESDVVVNVNSESYIRNTCTFGIIFNVFDPVTFKPWRNAIVNGSGLYESVAPCNPSRFNNFEFLNDSAGRRKALAFLKTVPDGSIVVLRNQMYTNASKNQYIQNWMNDEATYGTGNTLYAHLKSNGVTVIDSIYKTRVFAAVFKKNHAGFKVRQNVSDGIYDGITLTVNVASSDSVGYITSPIIGPATNWKEVAWNGAGMQNDSVYVEVVGLHKNGSATTILSGKEGAAIDLSGINANEYPNIQLKLHTKDAINYKPYQLDGWKVLYAPVPEGAIAPNLYFSMKDTLSVGEPINFKVAFKNVSTASFDSLKVKMIITDQKNVQHVQPVITQKPLRSNDTLQVHYQIDTKSLTGLNTLYVEVNPDNDQAEKHKFNNFIYHKIFIRGDSSSPVMDVTFDNVHILNNDIVSAKPEIVIQMKDDAKSQLLDDSSLVKVQVRYPNGSLRMFNYHTDTLQFEPANTGHANGNTATVRFRPQFDEDGSYELIVSGKDKVGNKAGGNDYKLGFQVITKAMISNMLNYPNPFTTSTAFVFTLTGSEVPQNLKIQILTVTGKIVREITKEELGPIKVGRNITEFKWDGTDQYGQKLGNGIYLYRVVTHLNGKTLDKYTAENDKTDQYFNKGYGKMYLMR